MSAGRAMAFLLLLAPCALLPGGEAAAPTPAVNWVLPIFSDKEGYRILRATGAQAVPSQDKESVLVTDLGITVFSGDAAERVETVFLSPLATFSLKDNRASGDKTVRLVRDELEATAVAWDYDHAQKRVTLHGKVRMIFNAELKDLLK
jgi:lipopolysaccharide export system protein LptC